MIPCSPMHTNAQRNGCCRMSCSQCIHFLRFLEAMTAFDGHWVLPFPSITSVYVSSCPL